MTIRCKAPPKRRSAAFFQPLVPFFALPPVALAGIFPWQGRMHHEFESLSREAKVIARDKDRVIWSPKTAGVEFKDLPAAPKPAKTQAERLRQMKALAERFKATMTG